MQAAYIFPEYKRNVNTFNQKTTAMEYKVHKLKVNMNEDQQMLEQYLNNLRGEVVSIIPNVKPIFRPMGATAKVDFLLIIEKLVN
ncbi:hypothetical protein [uncultured Draconibacterium sp.]|uniref:hypothetical protein n=1 Tax=uncultured Draconibacterium sp. TaxID=1573823 RepID=UPI00261EF50C|nr:hypothetical protein [uncultured Draconibacterium sp.]